MILILIIILIIVSVNILNKEYFHLKTDLVTPQYKDFTYENIHTPYYDSRNVELIDGVYMPARLDPHVSFVTTDKHSSVGHFDVGTMKQTEVYALSGGLGSRNPKFKRN
jgi:hypothetical protein